MKKLLALLLLTSLFIACETTPGETTPVEQSEGSHGFINADDDFSAVGEATGKPILYLYPEEPTQVTASLTYQGNITTEYPQSTNGTWELLAQPDGTLSMNGRNYPYLFWEGISPLTQNFEFSEGFSVNRDDAISFLEDKLTLLGLNEKEQTDFITYWLPKMDQYEWTTVRFLYQDYADLAQWTITPAPDSFIRVFVIMQGSEEEVKLPLQNLVTAQRSGFSAVEWGGTYFETK